MPKSYCEMTIKGSPELIKGFVIGFVEGRGVREEPLIEDECLIEEDSPLGLIMHFFTDRHHLTPVIVESELCKSLSESFRKHTGTLQATVAAVREITGAHFSFHYKTFSSEVGKSLLELFSKLPEGVRISDYEPREKITPDGKGVEAYAPLHDYELKAQGTVSGGIKEVYDLYCRAAHYDVVETGKLILVYKTEK